jgi:hypothetical protein
MKENIIIILIIKKINNIYLFNKKDKSSKFVNYILSFELNKNKLKSDSYNKNKFNNNFKLNKDNKRLSSIK